jgi:hypothetical protein
VRGAAVWLASCALLAFMPLPAAAQDALVGPVAGDGDDPVLAFAREESDLAELRAAVISAIEGVIVANGNFAAPDMMFMGGGRGGMVDPDPVLIY